MAADTFTLPNFSEPALYSRSNLAPITRSVKFALADITGAAGSAADPLETSDVIKLFKLPPDVKILSAKADFGDLESSTGALEIDLVVTNGTTTKYLFDGLTTVPRAAGSVNSADASVTGFVHAFTANSAIGWVVDNDNYYVAINVVTGATASGADDDIYVSVQYTSALESNEATFRT